MQVKYVNKALQRFDSTQVIPVQFVMFTLSVIIGSAVLYRDFEKATAENVGKFVGGCLLTFFGVWLITSGRSRHDDDDESESDEEEETIGLANQDQLEETTWQGGPQKFESVRSQSRVEIENGGDAAYDSDLDDSRRSSRVSFAEPSPGPLTPRMYSNTTNRPSLRVTAISSDTDLPSGSESTPLLTNPWKNAASESLQTSRHPGMTSMTSSPVLPSEAQTSTDSLKPPMSSRSATHENLHTHPNHQNGPTPPSADRPKTPRHSISRMLPGPLLSPLSSGLSAVVADSLRRGVDSPLRNRSIRRPRLGVRRNKSGSQRLLQGDDLTDDEYGTSPLKQSTTADDVSRSSGNGQSSERSRVTRTRSLSNTLGDLFRGKRQKTDRPEEDEDQGGPSGS